MVNKLFTVILFLLIVIFAPSIAFAKSNSFVSIVNPVRGEDFKELQNQKAEEAVLGQTEILQTQNLAATWLIRFDALGNSNITGILKSNPNYEKGLFLEVTPSWSREANVKYHESENWHDAGSAFLTGYEREERERLIDAAFEKFKDIFGYYPVSVGAWWIDSFSLSYMQEKYGIVASLIVADQYTTDNYQIWGQYFSTPYYPDKRNALHPAQSVENKIPVVISQWAARDPINGYGNGVFESTFSVQPNDYMDYHNQDINYFSKLVDIYTQQEFNSFGSLIVGLENTYDWGKYKDEYKRQINVLVEKSKKGQLSIVTLENFSLWYKNTFPELSPPHLIVADDSLGSFKKVVWFMNQYYRAGWFYNQDGSVFRDIRQYIEGEEEICFQKRCDEVNFATFATRVLDEVSFGHKWIIDEGRISDVKISKRGVNFSLSYLNKAGKDRVVEFLPRDISVDGKISSIDSAILDAIKQDTIVQKKQSEFKGGGFYWNFTSVVLKVAKFLSFLLIVCLLPGLVLVDKLLSKDSPYSKRIFLALITGSVLLTISFYIFNLLNLRFFLFIYILLFLLSFLRLKLFYLLKIRIPKLTDKPTVAAVLLIITGVIFQNIPTFKSGLVFPFGMGFWGPNTHDGIWHVSLTAQLIKGLPVENPIFADTILKNYHFFYDLLVATTAYLTKIPVLDLIFRFYPIFFSLLLGIGTYHLVFDLFKDRIGVFKTKIAVIFSLYFVYFAGSFGWMVSYLKDKTFAGESAFWANQSISFNLNPPFAISLLIVIAFLLLLNSKRLKSLNSILIAVLLAGSLVGFKAYGAVLVLGTILITGIIKRNISYLVIFFGGSFFAALVFFANFQATSQLIILSPFWLIHSMVDSSDRVGWARLSLARQAGFENSNWFKFLSAEAIGFVIFIFGNLGTRVLALFSILKIKSIIKDNILLFILFFPVLSVFIPILFIQSGNPWNTIQFMYYGLYVTALTAGVVLSHVFFKLPRFLSIIVILPILILTPINSIITATYYTGYQPHARVSQEEIEALDFLSDQEDGVVLTYPYDKKTKQKIAEPWPLFAYDSTAYVSGLSGQAVYLEDEGQNQIILTDYKKRLVASKDFFSNTNTQKVKFLLDNHIKYVYLPKIHNLRIDELNEIINIFENEKVIIYKVT